MINLLVTGADGQVGWEVQHALAPLGQVVALNRAQMNLADPDSIRAAIRAAAPKLIINAAAYTAVDKAESEAELAFRVNAIAPGIIAEEAKRLDALLIHYSTDYVFDGTASEPYIERDTPNPLSVYGKSKLVGELAIAAITDAHIILRTSWVYSLRGSNFVLSILRQAQEKNELTVVNDQIGAPTWARMLAEATVLLARNPHHAREFFGTYHLSAQGAVSRFDFARRIIEIARAASSKDISWAQLKPVTSKEYPQPAARPLNSVLNNEKIKAVFGIELPEWDAQLALCLDERVS